MLNQKIIVALGLVSIALTGSAGFLPRNKSALNVIQVKGFAVVELFTSEGCSSCPAADEALARLKDKNRGNVVVLEFHVDYWDRLGWKDPFSDAAYSQRQRDYAAALKLDGIYTPQAVVNGAVEFVGSDEQKLASTVSTSLQQAAKSELTLSSEKNADLINIHYKLTQPGGIINFVLVTPTATTQVKRGENSGRTMHHVNIVRALKTVVAAPDGIVSMRVPSSLAGQPLNIIAFSQSATGSAITAVGQIAL